MVISNENEKSEVNKNEHTVFIHEEKIPILNRYDSVVFDKIEIDKNIWHSCCFKLNPSAVRFFSVYFMLISVMFYSMYKLNFELDCPSQNTYIGLITFIIGIITPSPKL